MSQRAFELLANKDARSLQLNHRIRAIKTECMHSKSPYEKNKKQLLEKIYFKKDPQKGFMWQRSLSEGGH